MLQDWEQLGEVRAPSVHAKVHSAGRTGIMTHRDQNGGSLSPHRAALGLAVSLALAACNGVVETKNPGGAGGSGGAAETGAGGMAGFGFMMSGGMGMAGTAGAAGTIAPSTPAACRADNDCQNDSFCDGAKCAPYGTKDKQ